MATKRLNEDKRQTHSFHATTTALASQLGHLQRVPLPPSLSPALRPPHSAKQADNDPQRTNNDNRPKAKSNDPEDEERVGLSSRAKRCPHCWMICSANALQPDVQVAFFLAQSEQVADSEAHPQPVQYAALSTLTSQAAADLLNRSVLVPISAMPVRSTEDLPRILSTAEIHIIKHTLMTVSTYREEREIKNDQTLHQFSRAEQLSWQKSFKSQARLQDDTIWSLEDELAKEEGCSSYDDEDPRARIENYGRTSGIRVLAGTSATVGVRACPRFHGHSILTLKTAPWFWDGSKTGEEMLAADRQTDHPVPHQRELLTVDVELDHSGLRAMQNSLAGLER